MRGRERSYSYSKWDGSQKVDLRWERLTDELLEKFLQTGDFNLALEWLLRQGYDFGPEGPVMKGLNELVEKLLEKRRHVLSNYNAAGIAEEIQREIDDIVRIEKETVAGYFEKARRRYDYSSTDKNKNIMENFFSKEVFLDSLPKGLRHKLEALKDYKWQNAEAEQRYRILVDSIKQIQELVSNNWFTGSKPMSLKETVEAVRMLKNINQMIDAIKQGRLRDIDMDSLTDIMGRDAAQSIETMLQFMDFLQREGFIREADDDWELTTKAVKRIAQRALKDIYSTLHSDSLGIHETFRGGPGDPLPDRPRPYRYGDPLHVDLKATMFNALARKGAGGIPIEIEPDDLMVADSEFRSTSATALLLDMSLSMIREGRFAAAKKVAIALDHMIRNRFSKDKFYIIGFATVAKELRGNQLINAKGAMGGDIFTNIQDAIKLASNILDRSGARNKQIILVTDGQPTAYSKGGELHVEWPVFGISPRAVKETLKEVGHVTGKGIVINTFMLDAAPELMNFIDKMTRINKGRAFYTTPDKLGQYLLVDFVSHRKKTLH